MAEGAGQAAEPFFLLGKPEAAPKPVMDPTAEGGDPRHRGKGELQAHASGGIGVLKQKQHQRKGEAGGRIGLPAQNRAQQEQRMHHDRPQDRRGAPHRQGVDDHQRHGQQGGAPSIPAPGQGHRQLDQKTDVQSRYRHRMGQPGPLEGRIVRIRESRLVPGEERRDQRRGVGRHCGGHPLLKRPGPVGRHIAERDPLRARTHHASLGIRQKENALGGVIRAFPAPDQVRRAALGHAGEHVPRPEGQQGVVPVELRQEGGSLLRRDPDGDGPAVICLPGPVGSRGGERQGPPLHRSGRRAAERVITPAPEKSAG